MGKSQVTKGSKYLTLLVHRVVLYQGDYSPQALVALEEWVDERVGESKENTQGHEVWVGKSWL